MSAQDNLTFEWSICALCQKITQEKLLKPKHDSYELLARNIKGFLNINQLPLNLNESLLDSLNESENVFSQNHAMWHKSCYIKFKTTKLKRAQSRFAKTDESIRISAPLTRSVQQTEYDCESCLFCELPGTNKQPLSAVMNKKCNDTIIDCARLLEDYQILAKVSERFDLIALEAKYHNKCFTSYKNKRRALDRKKNLKAEAINSTFAQLIAHINEAPRGSNQNVTFSIKDLAELQQKLMKDLGFDYNVHNTRLKQKILNACPYLMVSESEGMSSLLTFRANIDDVIRSTEPKDDELILSEASKIVRRDIFNNNNDANVPSSLLNLVKMILFGPSAETVETDEKLCLSMSQLLLYHSIKYKKRGDNRRHAKSCEMSAPVYLAAKIYAETRKKTLINCTYQLGMSISYQTLQSILLEKANSVCEMHHREEVVCPPKMCKGVFTTAAVDNIDHNPTSTTAKTAFHGTAITLMQHNMPDEVGLRRDLPPVLTNDQGDGLKTKIMQLPSHYSIVPPCFIDLNKYTCTRSDIYTQAECNQENMIVEEKEWLDSTMTEEFKSWTAHHATSDCDLPKHLTEISLLPIFREQAHTTAMMVHSMNVIIKAIKFLSPDQLPVLVADQPLYALLKQIQYTLPQYYGENEIFVMMGGLHIEMAALKVIGQWLKASGWSDALVEAKVTTTGRSEALLQGTNVKRTRYACEVTAAALYNLMYEAYQASSEENVNEAKPFQQWRLENNRLIPQFKYWNIAFDLITKILRFVRSIRVANFDMYLDSIRMILPWFFALDHVNYARWLSVHLRDLLNLANQHPEIFRHFKEGQFVARKTSSKFSGIAFDQAHEQMNAILKGDGGMIGLTENPDAFLKWLLAGPELADMVYSFERDTRMENQDTAKDKKHHSDTATNKNRFMEDVTSLVKTINNLGNPFLEQSQDLYNIVSKSIAPPEVVNVVFNIENQGEEQYMTFCKERLDTKGDNKVQDPIKLNKYPLLDTWNKRGENKTKAKIVGLKNDCSLFSKLYIATCEHRTGDLDSFFAHENQASPPSLSSMGKLRSCTKSDLLKSLTALCGDTTNVSNAPQVSVKILDGAALVHMLNPGQSKTFGEYAEKVFIPFLCKEISMVSRVDLVWDTYKSDSLKSCTREKRGVGQKTRVTANTKIPKGWANFLRENTNKEGLFSLLSAICHSYSFPSNKEVYITDGPNILTNVVRDTRNLAPCNHEEADTRMMVHLADAVAQGLTKIMLRTVDTDVVVLAIAQVPNFPEIKELWVHIGTGKHHRYLSCHDISASLGPQRSRVLPLFHSFTGCDNVSSFSGKGKKSAFDAWEVFPALTDGLLAAMEERIEEAFNVIEKYVIILYDRSSLTSSVNDCRKHLFTKKDRQLEHIPPTQAALKQHYYRAIYQGVYVWGQLQCIQNLPCPSSWGWKKVDREWQPVWTDLPVAAAACLEMVRCRCKKQCSNRCSCIKRNLKCSELCNCSGNCYI